MSSRKIIISLVVTLAPLCSSFAPVKNTPSIGLSSSSITSSHVLQASQHHDNNLFEDRTAANTRHTAPSPSVDTNTDIFERVGKVATSALLAMTLTFSAFTSPFTDGSITSVPSAYAADGAAIGKCLIKKCPGYLAKCIANPNCLANVACINTCNGKPDEAGCQVDCGNTFENDVVGEFNKCAVSDMDCVPQKPDDGSYPVPTPDKLVKSFDTNFWNGRWYITAGQNKLFDVFPCQVHFFTPTEPGKFFGKLNWRIEEPDGEFFTRDAVQEFVQDPNIPGKLHNGDNDYLHYQDDWYIIDYAADGNKDGVPPFAFVYYRGENDAWIGYGGVVVYTRDAKLPEVLKPRLREAAKKVNFDFDKDFGVTDNSCKIMEKGEAVVLREKFAGKMAIQTEKQLQQQAVMARTAAGSKAGGVEKEAEKDLKLLEDDLVLFEKELAKDVSSFEKEIVKDVEAVEKVIVKDVEAVEKEIVKDVVSAVSS